jgi:MFS-type transporter involved in bile tolerance (Atg22 family)
MSWQWLSIIVVWLLVALGAVLVGVMSPRDEYLTWLPIVLAGAIVLTFCIQLGIRRKEGFVTRVMASVVVSVLILAAATAVLAALG